MFNLFTVLSLSLRFGDVQKPFLDNSNGSGAQLYCVSLLQLEQKHPEHFIYLEILKTKSREKS